MPEGGVPPGTSHWSQAERRAASTRIWHTRDRIVRTPACAWPARKKFWRSGFAMYPDSLSISADSKNEPPNWIVGTRISVSPVITLVARLMVHRPLRTWVNSICSSKIHIGQTRVKPGTGGGELDAEMRLVVSDQREQLALPPDAREGAP